MQKTLSLLILTLLYACLSQAQSLAGIWKGKLQTASTEVHYELVISEDREKLIGYSLTIFNFNGIENIGVKTIKLKNKKGSVSLEDGELIFDNYTTPPKKVKFFGDLFLKTSDNMMVLNGTFITKSMDMRVNDSYTGTVWLQKQKDSATSKLMGKLNDLNLTQTLSFINEKQKEEPLLAQTTKLQKETAVFASKQVSSDVNKNQHTTGAKAPLEVVKPAAAVAVRKTEIIQSVFFSSDSLTLTLYDNGEVDGDTVSVVLNNTIVIAKRGLTSNPIKTVLQITPQMGDSLRLILYAENLGRIPPNTGLLILEDGTTRQEIRFAGDLQKNSAVILRRRKQ